MARILLIRHGSTDAMKHVLCGRMPDVHLNELGLQQARQLANSLKDNCGVDEVISSPLERTVETAEIIAAETGAQLQVDNGWIELNYGDWTGESINKIRGLDSWDRYNQSRSTSMPPGGESLTQVQARALDALQRILSRGVEAALTIAIVSHGDVIRALLALVLGIPLDYVHRFKISPASISEIAFDVSYIKVARINHTYRIG